MKLTDVLSMSPQTMTSMSLMNMKLSPETGDNSNIYLYVGLFAASVIAALVLLILHNRKNK